MTVNNQNNAATGRKVTKLAQIFSAMVGAPAAFMTTLSGIYLGINAFDPAILGITPLDLTNMQITFICTAAISAICYSVYRVSTSELKRL